MLKSSELKRLPYWTLKAMALAVARDIDAGHDKRDLLDDIFRAIRGARL